MLLNADAEAFQPPMQGFLFLPKPPPADVAAMIAARFAEAGRTSAPEEVTGPSPPDATTGVSASAPLLLTRPPDDGSWAGSDADASFPRPPSAFGPLAFATQSWSSKVGIRLEDQAGNTRSSEDGPGFDALGELQFAPASTTSAASDPATLPAPPNTFGPPSPEELAALPKIPWTANYTYDGTLAVDRDSTSFRIPVGPTTQMLTLAVRSDRAGESFVPRIDQMYLIGPRGEVLAALNGVSFLSNATGQSFYIELHGAPTGGQLVVRLVPSTGDSGTYLGDDSDSTGEDAGGGGGDVPTWDATAFHIDVQRSDASPKAVSPQGSSSTGTSYVITLPVVWGDAWTGVSVATPGGTTPQNPEAASSARVADDGRQHKDSADFESDDEETPSVFLGPLVSRTAAPLGPVLATSTDDPTPSTDRASRTDRDSVDAFAADLDVDLMLGIKLRSEGRSAGDLAENSGGHASAMMTIRGPGGAPVVVSGLRQDDSQQDADALAANLQRQAEEGALLAEALEAPTTSDDAARKGEIARAGLATRAVGFLIGLGLASGPLYPDLVAFARKKLVRRAHLRRPGLRKPKGR
ncbi:hypothetical protein [Paludisphaera mucosa]|uniref:Uncharacterized protein n=1 Tax=Paludisphaera mucosa TaxID=3030827 RepID=A0ABT6FDU0_9BACT|nr:hypothetical protein [Paludisphaera mucosa]MDG3005666.1 hypothetical protein [Paludisphaera mucosa]